MLLDDKGWHLWTICHKMKQNCNASVTSPTLQHSALTIGLWRVLPPTLVENGPFWQIQPKSGSFGFLGGFSKWCIQILQCSIFHLVLKNYAVHFAVISHNLFTLLRSRHHPVTDEISLYPSSLSSFMNTSQIRPQLQPDFSRQIRLQKNKTRIQYSPNWLLYGSNIQRN